MDARTRDGYGNTVLAAALLVSLSVVTAPGMAGEPAPGEVRIGFDQRIVPARGGDDVDADGVPDGKDNCIEAWNPEQKDTDDDGIGNRCDPDYDNNCSVTFTDLAVISDAFYGDDPNVDLNCDGAVNFIDLGIMKSFMFKAPGPSGVANDCE